MTLQTHIANARRIAEEAREIARQAPLSATEFKSQISGLARCAPDLATQLEAALRVIEVMERQRNEYTDRYSDSDCGSSKALDAECAKAWEGGE